MRSLVFILILFACLPAARGDDALAESWQYRELRRFPAEEAHQGVAVDEDFFYAITNRAIGKYRKESGTRVAGWEDAPDGRLRHLNAGVIFEGKLYCAHSNFPVIPEESSVEVWDPATMRHLKSFPFEKPPGSLTWVDRHDGKWVACFAHYRATSDPARSLVMSFDDEWRPLAKWTFPAAVIARFGNNSSSGGSFGPGGHLFVSGHDAPELYLLDLPRDGGEMSLRSTVAISAAGQAFAWDRTAGEEGVLYSIQRKTKEIIVSSLLKIP